MKSNYLFQIILVILLIPYFGFAQELNNKNSVDKNNADFEESSAFSPGLALSIKASSLGFGGEVVKSFNKKFNLRLGGSYYKRKNIIIIQDFGGTSLINPAIGGINLFADWQFVNFMHLTGGIIYDLSHFESETIVLGNQDLTEEIIGSVYYNIQLSKINPYLGFGFGRAISKNKIVSFNVDLGVIYLVSPSVDMTTTGTVDPKDYEDERISIEKVLNDYPFYPLINFQLSFRIL